MAALAKIPGKITAAVATVARASTRLAACYFSLHEQLFLENLQEDLESFLQTTDSTEVIVLPPLCPRYRYLTHNLVQNEFPPLRSVSIGSDKKRRTVIFLKPQTLDSNSEKVMSMNSVGNQGKKNLSIGRGRGKRSDQQKPIQIQNIPSGSKSESQSKTPDKTLSMRVSRGRGWKRPDQAIYVPKALRKKDNVDGQSPEDKSREEDEVCQLVKKDKGILSDYDSFLEQKSADRHSLTRQYPEKEETAVSVASRGDQKSCNISNEKEVEPHVNTLSESVTAGSSCSNDAAPLDTNKNPVDISDINQDCYETKNESRNEKVKEEATAKILRTVENQDTCTKRDEKEEEQKLWESEGKTGMDSEGSADGTQMIDICQSMPLVTSCEESDKNEQNGQKLLENQDVRKSTTSNQQKPVIDSFQTSSSVESYHVDDDTKSEEEVQENILNTDQQQCLTSNTSLMLNKSITEKENLQKEESEFSEKNQVLGIETKEKENKDSDVCQSSLNVKELNTGFYNKHDIILQDSMSSPSSEGDVALENDSKIDETCDDEGLPEETSKICVFNKALIDLKDELPGILKENSEGNHVDDKSICSKSEVSREVNAEVTPDELLHENSSEKNETVSGNQEDQRESDDFKVIETQGDTESEQGKNVSILEVGNNEEGKIDSDNNVNNEMKSDEKDAKHKKKSKKKKGDDETKEEKKKKKSKKKESENGEPKEKENDEKRKLKKKEKKKASREDSESKSKDHKSKKNAKDKKDRNDGNDEDSESWESKFNEDGECLDPELLEELTEVTGIKKPSKRKTQFDYYALPPKEVIIDEDSGYGHIAELYDFSPELKTQDLVQLLSSFKNQGDEIKWVDDTHALAVFSSEIAAKQAIQMCSSPIIKLRPVSQGISESKSKAKRCFSVPQPYKPRPKTTKLAAHRLVTGALGVRSTMSKEEREREKEKIKEAKEQKRQEKQRKADVWGD
ncbi:coiled-coil domain-containing protein R3HCC1L-like [Actinia tenebrosa]|uniref:Coiled-coil domain-containing protein R3HCC1L-like n=1 Tax=Actinia tenebrosa TaxID=6105 RepID=A0A6P8J5G0_ACTTE|nr:coiled-coil domain-containing protein R3HCC1L-like [Actinia tenebrosa]